MGLLLRGVRWARQALLWRLRNRLIVTYVFIGVIPIILLFAMFLLGGYLFAGQFATYIALSDLDSELQHLVTANNALASQIRTLTLQNKLTPQLAAEISSASGEGLSGRTVTVLEGEKGFQIEPDGKTVEIQREASADGTQRLEQLCHGFRAVAHAFRTAGGCRATAHHSHFQCPSYCRIAATRSPYRVGRSLSPVAGYRDGIAEAISSQDN